ncbi:hypothetical protein QQZ08_009516 [Neonectria magnoliae]|uniref:C2H2-type domain-containing protein n=1 Tax=Neonectria magnoliae TaxID=2732573 RepID=A0ABR1HNN2_9HYPO
MLPSLIPLKKKYVDCHQKPYRCKAESCRDIRFASADNVSRHERETHGKKSILCIHDNCDRAAPGNGFSRQRNCKDHKRRVHAPDASKGRKRKTEVPDDQASSRKATVKSMPALDTVETSLEPFSTNGWTTARP